jgi:hypothetical protein
MQKRDSPYTPGAGRKPPMLAGRDRDLEDPTTSEVGGDDRLGALPQRG